MLKSAHNRMAELDAAGDAYSVLLRWADPTRRANVEMANGADWYRYDVMSHGPDHLTVREDSAPDGTLPNPVHVNPAHLLGLSIEEH